MIDEKILDDIYEKANCLAGWSVDCNDEETILKLVEIIEDLKPTLELFLTKAHVMLGCKLHCPKES